ncbi:hypothetical protein [Streptomyces himalayensis]|uniref:Uncharacterized protein n=1 Tax=Streptomyces himalayensis subsp. himalayensis TaxID=2756131 RepID=A0A7W0DUP5_9ACTN|nr:hypothetical protein [Streptomyces himalayensis]MBA2951607.1 hypothetical protein [Streptomyces himalayensis subsp. himalayensis]
MRRHPVLWLLAALFLIAVGLWPAAVTPVALAATGLAAVIGAIPGPVLVLAAVVAYLRHRPARPAHA